MNQYVRDASYKGVELIIGSGQQEIQCKLQGNNWSGLPDEGGFGGRSAGHYAGTIKIVGRGSRGLNGV